MEFFTADLHFSHNKEFICKEREFNSINEYDEALIDKINKKVGKNDTLWILGDVSWTNPIDFLNQLKCKNIKIVYGNHDTNLIKSNKSGFDSRKKVEFYYAIVDAKISGKNLTLCHYPMVSWSQSHRNSILLYGHVHQQKLPIDGKMFDVSPTKEHLSPYSEEEIFKIMETKPNNWDFIEKN